MMTNSLVWYRNDLRIHDHEPLLLACQRAAANHGRVICLYVVDPFWHQQTKFGFPRTGAFRAKFLRESLEDLDRSLRGLGGQLVIAHGETELCVADLAESTACDEVFCTHEPATEEKRIERRLLRQLQRRGIKLNVSPQNTLYDVDDLPFTLSELPESFSRFRRKAESRVDVRAAAPSPAAVPTAASSELPDAVFPLSDPRFKELPELLPPLPPKTATIGIQLEGGETSGLARMQTYFFERDCLRAYKKTRNGMLGEDYSSKLSPWLAMGCLSPRKVFEQVRRYEQERVKNESTYWLTFELLWRDYFAFVLAKHGANLFRVGGLRRLRLPWTQDRVLFEAWRDGLTGFPLIDANMRELAATGFMSNRGRQNVASFLTKNLGVDWRMGAEWFESMLIDYDPASNYGNWNYTAGIGNDTRGFRWFNTLKQASMYDRRGDYVRHWLPELAGTPTDYIHCPWKMHPAEQARSGCRIGEDYPAPIVDLFESANHHQELFNQIS